MDREQFYKEGRWLNYYGIFGNREIVMHCPAKNCQEISFIRSLSLNPSYPAQKNLSERLTQQLYSLSVCLRQKPDYSNSIKIEHFVRMMEYILKQAESQTQSYHNILYLTVKYLAYLVTKQAVFKGEELQDEARLQHWLADVNAIYFQLDGSEGEDIGTEEQLYYALKKGNYEELISKLRLLRSRNNQTKKSQIDQKIDLIIHLLIMKVNDRLNCLPQIIQRQQHKSISQKGLQSLKYKFTKLLKIVNGGKKQKDFCNVLSRVITGDQSQLERIAGKSWALYAMFFLNFSQKNIKQVIQAIKNSYISKDHLGRASSLETEYLLALLEDSSNHQIYQKLLSIVPPFYAHFLGYLFTQVRPSPIPSVFAENYNQQIVINMLDHASQINFSTLAFAYSALEGEDNCDLGISQIFQTLLYHHTKVIDPNDREEVNDFLNKVRVLSMLKLERYVYLELNSLLKESLENMITKQTLLLYGYSSALFQNYYNYQELLAYSFEQKFMEAQLNVTFLAQYEALKNSSQLDRKVVRELKRVEPLIQKFYLFEKIINQHDIQIKMTLIGELMQKTYRSLGVLELLEHILVTITNKTNIEEHQDQYYGPFLKEINLFLLHYPIERTNREQLALERVGRLVNRFGL